jgi:hypothetical protein
MRSDGEAMTRFRDVFPARHTILPIIHVSSREQALRNVRIARDCGADGCFLISLGECSDEEVLEIHHQVSQAEPCFWIGLNCLGIPAEELFTRISAEVPGVWVDDALIVEGQEEQTAAQRILSARRLIDWPGLYFGGVAFKYQRPVRDPADVARRAKDFMDVVTTSGPGTGLAAEPGKIRRMKQAIGDFPLAVASGVTPENVTDYLSYADCFLVATGISSTLDELDPPRVRDLIRVVRSWQPPTTVA